MQVLHYIYYLRAIRSRYESRIQVSAWRWYIYEGIRSVRGISKEICDIWKEIRVKGDQRECIRSKEVQGKGSKGEGDIRERGR